ncbi:MAG: amidohydrolase family protein, partial [Spirochaetes bacterium]|nr:amidohydrolase family protein [Spirochaetota bacterium]
MTVYEGSIISCDAAGGAYRFLVEDGGRIAFVGDGLPEAYRGLPRVALDGKALLPAFTDTHIHFMSYALFSAGLDVRSAQSITEAKETVADFAGSRKDSIVLGFGASPHSVAERRLLSRADLDAACPNRPAYIVKYDGHAAIANSALLSALPAGTASLRGYDGASGLLTQEAFFRATDFVTGKVSLPSTLGNMLSAIDSMAAMGVGALHSVTGVGFPMDLDVGLESLFARGIRNPMTYRVFFQTMDVEKVRKRGLPRIGGCFATALDGCFGSADAALLKPYAPAAGLAPAAAKGVLYYPDSRVRDFCVASNRAGLQIEIHAIGDAAFDQAVSSISAALDDFPRDDHRHTIIHACLPTVAGLEACARRGIAIALQPAFLDWAQEPLEYLESILGDRAMRLSPLRTMRDMGIVMAGGSDAPCTVPDPIAGIHAACNHYAPGQSLGVQEALDLYTRNAAYVGFDDGERGSLEAGKIADMVVLDGNPLAVPVAELRGLRVEGLFLAGKP